MTTAVHRFCLGSSLLALCVVACDRTQPLEPAIRAASTGGSGSTMNAPSGTNALAASESRIDVTWQDNSTSETGFEVYRSTSGPAGTYTLRVSTGAGVTSFSDAGLTQSTQYCYKIRALKVSGRKTSYSPFSSTACATTLAPPPPPPAAPSGVDAVPLTSTRVWVGWVDNSINEAGFRVERSLSSGASWTIAATLGSDFIDFSDYGRASEQQVCYRVIAFNAGGDSPPSNADCTTPPAAPTDLAVAGMDSVTMEVELSWRDNSSVEDGYEVVACFDTCTTWDRLPANSTSYFVPCGDVTSYFVAAMKDGGYSDGSNPVNPAFTPVCSSSTETGAKANP